MFDFQTFWRQRGILNTLLLPASALFAAAAALRRRFYLPQRRPYPPLIIVGNLVAGGSGKTPTVIALARQLAAGGYYPGVISRGSGGRYREATMMVEPDSDWRLCGDEPLLIRRQAQVPVCVGRRRLLAARRLARAGCDVIISDDGLQHYALPRSMEICLVDAAYRLGNGWLLPAGPLREGRARLKTCDLCLLVKNSADDKDKAGMLSIHKTVRGIYKHGSETDWYDADFFSGKQVTGLAGIARPQRFFKAAQSAGIDLATRLGLADHGVTDLAAIKGDIILMSEKDAVKYAPTDERCYVLAIECELPKAVMKIIRGRLRSALSEGGNPLSSTPSP